MLESVKGDIGAEVAAHNAQMDQGVQVNGKF